MTLQEMQQQRQEALKTKMFNDAKFSTADVNDYNAQLDKLTGHNPGFGEHNFDMHAGFHNKVYGMHFGRGKDVILAQDSAQAKLMAESVFHDADTQAFGIASNGVPEVLASVFVNKIIEQLFQTTQFSALTHEFQQGVWGTPRMYIPTVSRVGASALYADNDSNGHSEINLNYVSRGTVRLQNMCQYGDLQNATYSFSKINYMQQIKKTALEQIRLEQNRIGFRGFAGKEVYGFLNAPELLPVIPSPASAAEPTSSQWIYKTAPEIYADILLMYDSIVQIAGGNVDPRTVKVKLGVPPAVFTFLLKPNALFTDSAYDFIMRQFPNLEIIQVQDLQGTGSPIGSVLPNYALMVLSELNGQECALNAFSSILQSHGAVRLLSSVIEKLSYTVSGMIAPQPIGIGRMSGI